LSLPFAVPVRTVFAREFAPRIVRWSARRRYSPHRCQCYGVTGHITAKRLRISIEPGKPKAQLDLPKPSGLEGGTAEEIHAAFRARAKSLRCPNCTLEFTDSAVDWGLAWLEGRRDLMIEWNRDGRDGPFKMKCELCGHTAWSNAFLSEVTRAEPPDRIK
jgi:hypothetical protein